MLPISSAKKPPRVLRKEAFINQKFLFNFARRNFEPQKVMSTLLRMVAATVPFQVKQDGEHIRNSNNSEKEKGNPRLARIPFLPSALKKGMLRT